MWQQPEPEHGIPTKWGWTVYHPRNFINGRHTDIGMYTFINAHQGVVLEDDVQIGSHCAIISVSTIDGKQGEVTVKRNAKIGAHCVVMPGVTVGEYAVVGACSFVNRDIPDHEMWYGVPVRFIRNI